MNEQAWPWARRGGYREGDLCAGQPLTHRGWGANWCPVSRSLFSRSHKELWSRGCCGLYTPTSTERGGDVTSENTGLSMKDAPPRRAPLRGAVATAPRSRRWVPWSGRRNRVVPHGTHQSAYTWSFTCWPCKWPGEGLSELHARVPRSSSMLALEWAASMLHSRGGRGLGLPAERLGV